MTISDIILTPVLLDLRFFDFTDQYYSVLKTRISLFENYTIRWQYLTERSVLIKLSCPDQCKKWFTSEGIVAKVMLNHNAEIGRDVYFGDYEEVADDEDYEDL